MLIFSNISFLAQIVSAELLKEEVLEITSIIKNPATVIVFGQTPYSKLRIANELLGRNIFPPLEHSDFKLRMVRICQGTTDANTQPLPDSNNVVDNADTNRGLNITLADLEISEGDKDVSTSDMSVLDMTQNHPVLKFGTRIVISPSCQEDHFEEAVKRSIENSTPILIYGITNDVLTEVVCIPLVFIIHKICNIQSVRHFASLTALL